MNDYGSGETFAPHLAKVAMLLAHGPERGRQLLSAHRKDLDVFHRRNERMLGARRRSVPAVALVGQSNVGKSTLLNALFDAPAAPVGNGPCTSCPVEYEWGERIEIEFQPTGGTTGVRRVILSDYDALRHFLNHKGFACEEARIRLPVDFLKGIMLVDTPGFGAAEMEDTARHLERLTGYLARRSCPVFWCIKSTQPPEQTAMEYYRDHLLGLCDDIVITHADRLGADSRANYRKLYAPYFPDWRMPPLHFIAAKEDPVSVETMREVLRAKAQAETNSQVVGEELIQLCHSLARSIGPNPAGSFNEIVWQNEFVHSTDPFMRRLGGILASK